MRGNVVRCAITIQVHPVLSCHLFAHYHPNMSNQALLGLASTRAARFIAIMHQANHRADRLGIWSIDDHIQYHIGSIHPGPNLNPNPLVTSTSRYTSSVVRRN